MSTPELDLQAAIVRALRLDPALTLLIDGRVYDMAPAAPAFPYITLGDTQTLAASYDCIDGSEIVVAIDVWSRAVGQVEVKRITGAVRKAIDGVELGVDETHLVDFVFEQTQFLTDPDGLTHHAAMSFRAITEPA